MKKSALAAGVLAVVVVAAGGGWLAVHMVETKTEQAVRDMLADISATAQSVEYDLLRNTLHMGQVSYTMELGDMRGTTNIEDITLTGFDRACLDPAASGPELPLVADSLVATNLTVSSTGSGADSRGGMAEVRMEGWRQNLGKLAAAYRQEPWGEAFFAEVYRYRVEMMAYKDYRMSVEVPDHKPLTMSMALYGLLGPAGSASAEGEAGRTLSLFINDVRMTVPDVGSVGAERVEIHDLLLPPPAAMKDLTHLLLDAPSAQDLGSQAMREAGEAMVKVLGNAYRGTTPYKEIVVRSYALQPSAGNASPRRFEELRNRLSLADPFVFGLDMIGYHGDWNDMPEDFQAEGRVFLPDGFLLDGSLQLSLRPDKQESTVDWSSGVRGLGRIEGKNSLLLNVADMDEMLNMPEGQLVGRVFLKDADVVYTDHGLEALALTAFARNQGISAQALRARLLEQLPSLSQQAGELGPMLEKAASVMLDKPGTVRIQCRPEEPLALNQALMILLIQPRALNLTVTAEPGDKTLLDWIPAALQQEAPESPAAATGASGSPDDAAVGEKGPASIENERIS